MGLLFRVACAIFWRFKKARYDLRLWAYRRMGCHIGRNVRLFGDIDGVNPSHITIGDNTVLAVRANIIAHCPVRGPRAVTIGRNCYIGYAALILPGVTIGDNCVIGAGSIVTKDIAAGMIAAGNPARVLRPRDPAEIARTVERIEKGLPIAE